MGNVKTTLLTIPKSDCKSLLNNLYCTIETIDYPNTGIFSECLKLLIQSYLRGRGVRLDGINQQKDKEQHILFLADTLWDMAVEHESYDWFIRWIVKLEKVVKERELKP